MLRTLSAVAAVAMVGATLALAAPASSHPARAQAASTCPLSQKDWKSFGYSYMQKLWVYGTSCTEGRYVAKKHGKVKGWRCSTKKLDSSPVQYNAKETCTSGRSKVVWQYTQNT
jgi:ABC-type sugar transport system substrate-binding protein